MNRFYQDVNTGPYSINNNRNIQYNSIYSIIGCESRKSKVKAEEGDQQMMMFST